MNQAEKKITRKKKTLTKEKKMKLKIVQIPKKSLPNLGKKKKLYFFLQFNFNLNFI